MDDTTASESTVPPRPRALLFGPSHRATTIGMLLLVSMVAFEAMGVNTAMPALVADLGGVQLYAWPFVAFMASGVLGTVTCGRLCDLIGPRLPLVVAPILFGAGLITAGSAGAMPQLLVGRVLQGLGAGAVTVAMYVLIARIYPERARPAMFGAMSSAWVLPSLIGPPVSGLVTERLSWRWVFFGLVPVVVLALALVVPAVRRLEHTTSGGGPRRRGLIPAAFGAALGISAVVYASERPSVAAGVVAAVGLLVLVGCLKVLLPAGVFRARRGVPSVVAARGLCASLFFTANSYLPLILHDTHHWSLAAAGIPLVIGSLGWSGASAWQGGKPDLPRPMLLRCGFALLTFGVVAMLPVAAGWGAAPPWLAIPIWAASGFGMGLCFPSVSFLLLRQSEPAVVGFHTSAAQMCDQLGTATMIGLGGAFLALLGTAAAAMPVLLAVLAVLGALGILVAPRTTTSP